MFAKTKEFIESHKILINENRFTELFIAAVNDDLAMHEINELATMLEVIGIETERPRWMVFEQEVQKYVKKYLLMPSFLKNKSNDWSRVDYMLNKISTLGFGDQSAKYYLVKNGRKLGLNLLSLEPQYGWYGSGDYDLGWFDKEEYEKENPK